MGGAQLDVAVADEVVQLVLELVVDVVTGWVGVSLFREQVGEIFGAAELERDVWSSLIAGYVVM